MVIVALLLVPFVAGLIAFWLPSRSGRRGLLLCAAVVHSGLTSWLWYDKPELNTQQWLAVDTLGLLFLTILSGLFLASAVYCIGYLKTEEATPHVDREEGFLFTNEPEAVFIGCLLMFLGSMSLVTLSQHFGLIWVGIEATTLASAPLIYFHRNHRSLEATWKYLLICSVGIALALLGDILLSVSASKIGGDVPFLASGLLQNAGQFDSTWLKAAFLFFLVGYGTKMGLAPMHTWLPDAHSEAPSPVSALLSGALLNCAFLGILRVHQLCVAAGEAEFSNSLLVMFGLLSMTVAAVFIIRQADFKRMLAYSSVEHMGIMAIGIGLGGVGVYGALFHAFNHSLTKAALFLVAGNILLIYRSKRVENVRGVSRLLPLSGMLWIAGFLAITGSPPFGTFLSEFTILKAALEQGYHATAIIYLVMLALIFIGMANIFLKMAQGNAPQQSVENVKEQPAMIAPPLLLMALVLALGVYVPPRLDDAFTEVATGFEKPKIQATVSQDDAGEKKKQ